MMSSGGNLISFKNQKVARTEICGHDLEQPGCFPLREGLTMEHRWMHYVKRCLELVLCRG